MESMKELLAEYAHSIWSGWMKHLFSKSIKNKDGSVTIPSELVFKWTQQMKTPYIALTEKEKESDRVIGDGSIEIFNILVKSLEQEHKEALQRIEQLKIECNTYAKRLVLLGEDDVIWYTKEKTND